MLQEQRYHNSIKLLCPLNHDVKRRIEAIDGYCKECLEYTYTKYYCEICSYKLCGGCYSKRMKIKKLKLMALSLPTLNETLIQKYKMTDKIIKQGRITKKSAHLKQLRDREMILQRGVLSCWSKPRFTAILSSLVGWELTEKFDLKLYDSVYASYDDKKNITKFVLKSSFQKTKRMFVAPTFQDMHNWINVIKKQLSKKGWNCSLCTFLNVNDMCNCTMCGNSKLNIDDNKMNDDEEDIKADLSKADVEETYSRLIDFGFNGDISTEASTLYPLSINKAIKHANKLKGLQISDDIMVKKIVDDQLKNNEDDKSIAIPLEIIGLRDCIEFEEFIIISKCSDDVLIGDLILKATVYIEKLYYPRKFRVFCVKHHSFIGKNISCFDNENYASILNTPITKYSKHEIATKGLRIGIEQQYFHTIKFNKITCKHMINSNTDDPCFCPIYLEMKEQYTFNQEHLSHLNEYEHFNDEFGSKIKCKFGQECYAFIRLEKGGNNIEDQCHVKLFRHPPRRRVIKLQENMKHFLINKHFTDNHAIYVPEAMDSQIFNYNAKDGYLNALIWEVIYNGYKSDLCLNPEDVDDDNFSILQIVDQKMKSKRHKNMESPLTRGQMLALILYTGCDCNYDLCASQRKGDYEKWRWFDFCLYYGIQQLSYKESGSYKLYSGLNNVKLDKREIKNGYFITYISTTWIKEVSSTFAGDEGMIIEIDKSYREQRWTNCCDVSWISKFPDEYEVLISRSAKLSMFTNDFSCSILDEQNGIQTISLTKSNNMFAEYIE